MTPMDRYLKVVMWARKRYTKDGRLITYVGDKPSTYKRIEDLAWVRLVRENAALKRGEA